LTHFYTFSNWNEVDINTHEPYMFGKLLKSIKFTNKFNNMSDNCILVDRNNKYVLSDFNKIQSKINVIHLRLENDMTYNMSVHNKLDEKDYIKMLEDKYIDVISKYFSKEEKVLVLSYDTNNRVVKYLYDNDYDYYTTKKNMFCGREPHAIIDLLVGEKCTGTFIGNWNHEKNIGSTFSYVLDTRIDSNVKRVFLDIYNIYSEPVLR